MFVYVRTSPKIRHASEDWHPAFLLKVVLVASWTPAFAGVTGDI